MKLLLGLILIFYSSGADFNSQLKSFLKKSLSNYESFTFEIVTQPKNYERMIIPDEGKLNLNGDYAYVTVNLFDKQGNKSISYLTVKLKLYRKLLVANRFVPRGKSLTTKMFVLKKVKINGLNGKPLTDANELDNYNAQTTITPGQVLTENLVYKRPVINVGDKILAKYQKSSIQIKMEAFARQAGCIGEDIQIRASGNKLFTAKVIDSKTVFIIE